jgi:hypothetical protein
MSVNKCVTKGWLTGAAVTISVLLMAATVFADSAPRLNLFPKDVTEYLSQTGTVAKSMETDLKGVISGLETQMKLYQASGCSGSDDPGCAEIAKQMGDRYNEMLQVMKASLPEMKQSVTATHNGIEKNLRKELGEKTTPADIQRLLGKAAEPKVMKGRFSLSSRFAKYHQLISSGNQDTLASLAAEIYLDSGEVMKMIDMMDAEIAQQQTIIKLGGMYGTLTPQMANTVEAVKNVIFGEDEGENALPTAPPAPNAGGFQSPLEMQ